METLIVKKPLERPDYVFYHTPTTDELRQRAVQAMRDFLSIQWTTHKKIAHNKTGPVSGKRFIYEPNVIYAGLPYTNGGKGLFQFYEFYEQDTGKLHFYKDGVTFNEDIGGTCACGVIWSLSTVCHTLGGKYINFWMTPKYGFVPVGDLKISDTIEEYRMYHTSRIIEENGLDCVLDAYCKIQPADAVTSSPNDHTMMCIDYPHVEKDDKGKIDLDNSYVMIQDQRGGMKAGFFDKRMDDDLIHYSGRTEFKYTFRMLLDEFYIPVTAKEFLGLEPYQRADVRFSETDCATREALAQGTVTCNYPMAVIKLMLTKRNGVRVMADRYMFDRGDPHSGLARAFPMSRMAEAISAADGVKLEIEVTASNGEIMIPAAITL